MEISGRTCSVKKELVVLEGWSHYDLFDKPEPVSQSGTPATIEAERRDVEACGGDLRRVNGSGPT